MKKILIRYNRYIERVRFSLIYIMLARKTQLNCEQGLLEYLTALKVFELQNFYDQSVISPH